MNNELHIGTDENNWNYFKFVTQDFTETGKVILNINVK